MSLEGDTRDKPADSPSQNKDWVCFVGDVCAQPAAETPDTISSAKRQEELASFPFSAPFFFQVLWSAGILFFSSLDKAWPEEHTPKLVCATKGS